MGATSSTAVQAESATEQNTLGVELGRQDKLDEAIEAFRDVHEAQALYAEIQPGFLEVLRAQMPELESQN